VKYVLAIDEGTTGATCLMIGEDGRVAGRGYREIPQYFPEAGHVEVSASTHNESVVVRVVDNGPGVPNEIKEQIFDPFFTTKPVGSGTGLGLDIARRLIRQHHGQIEIDSRPGRTEFKVTLPRA